MKKYAITYGNDNYKIQREFFKETAVKSTFFDEVRIFNADDINSQFAIKTGGRFTMKKGGGYWLWKPYLIKKMFDEMNNNDLLFYFDAGSMVNSKGKSRFEDYVEMLFDSETGTIDFELPYREYQYTLQETFNYFKSPENIINTNQLMSTILIFRKCAHSSQLVNTWYDVACNNPVLFTDEFEDLPQCEAFVAHRHDQSIFSVIRKQYGANILTDETWFPEFVRDGYNYPLWATRFRS